MPDIVSFKEWIAHVEPHDLERWLCDDFWHGRLDGTELHRSFLLSLRNVDMRTKLVEAECNTRVGSSPAPAT